MGQVVATDRVTIAITAEDEDVEVGAGKGDAGGEWQSAAVDEVDAVGVDEVGEARGAADAGDTDDFFVRKAKLLDDVEKGGEDGEVTAGRAPSRVIGFELLFGERFGGCAHELETE
jgi:hypothetical protein